MSFLEFAGALALGLWVGGILWALTIEVVVRLGEKSR